MPRFDFDPLKSAANKLKHGIDFIEAQEIWNDSWRLEIAARSGTEPRFQIVGMARGKIWSAFVTYREPLVRIISVRRARTEERRRYYEAT